MAAVSPFANNFAIGCYITIGIILLGSLLYMTFSKRHTVSLVICAIYLFEIISQGF